MSRITKDINLVLKSLKLGDIAAIPTETVYGLAADAFSETAIKKVFSTKNRPIDHPLIMHIAPEWDLTQWVSQIPDYAYYLMEYFWPGPLTLILPIKPGAISPLITGGQNSVAIRAPNHTMTKELLLQFGKPLVAPSANPYGKISPTTAEHVKHSFPNSDFLILDGGRCSIGLESTIVSALEPLKYEIARSGLIDEVQIENITSLKSFAGTNNLKAPGKLLTHYQPEKLLYYFDNNEKLSNYLLPGKTLPYVLTFSKNYQGPYLSIYEFPNKSEDAAYEFYYRLRIADQSEADNILIELPPNGPSWFTIREKIIKAGRPIGLN